MYLCMYVCSTYVCMCMYVCICVYACMYVCMYVHMYRLKSVAGKYVIRILHGILVKYQRNAQYIWSDSVKLYRVKLDISRRAGY